MFRSFKGRLTGAFQHDPQTTNGSSESEPNTSLPPSQWSTSARGERPNDTTEESHFTSSLRYDSPSPESHPKIAFRLTTIPSTSHLLTADFLVDGTPESSIDAPRLSAATRVAIPAIIALEESSPRQHTDASSDSSPRFVPHDEEFPLTKMFAPPTSGLPPSYHSSANPSLVEGFGSDGLDPAPAYDWGLAMDVDESNNANNEQGTSARRARHDQPRPPALLPEVPRRVNYYRAISADILADFDFPLPVAKSTATVTEATIPSSSTPPPQRGYRPTPASILEDFDISPFSPQTTGGSSSTAASTPPVSSPPTRSRSTSKVPSLASNNPYVELLEQKEQAMTVAFLRRQDLGSGSRSTDLGADDFSFGQRYHKAADTTDVIVTRQRLPANDLGGSRECPICAETRDISSFPVLSVTPTCTHPPEACLECLRMSIKSDLNSKLWTDIQCPECRELLEYVDIQKYADEETFARYEALALRAAMAEADKFIWCTANCGSGQLHDTGADQPIVTCLHCGQRSCFSHNVTWHENLSCQELDALLQDPENFRSRIEMEHDEFDSARQAQEAADRAMAQGLMAEQQAEIQQNEARERAERERARKAVALARKVAARRKAEEEQSRVTVNRTTKPCPGCGWAIEKNSGCSHMTCSKCKHEFCYECGADHKRILLLDNSIHSESCRFHPTNLVD
ncbi:hypothetical protein CSPX01_10139 [Colletotrichum filicis]|nr:hypothetical protein CSPX01_10139 [Colletotrichum filicis]